MAELGRGEMRDFSLLEHAVEHLVAQLFGLALQAREIFQDEEPLVVARLQLIERLVELGYLDVLEGEFVVEHAVRLLVEQTHVVVYVLLGEGRLLQIVVKQSHHVDVLQLKVPRGAFRCLLADGEGGVVERAVLEIRLVGVLHLHDELLAALVLAIHVEDCLALRINVAHVLAVEVRHVTDHLLAVEEGVQEVDEQHLVGLLAEDALEPEIGQKADIFFFCGTHSSTNLSISNGKITLFNRENIIFAQVLTAFAYKITGFYLKTWTFTLT